MASLTLLYTERKTLQAQPLRSSVFSSCQPMQSVLRVMTLNQDLTEGTSLGCES